MSPSKAAVMASRIELTCTVCDALIEATVSANKLAVDRHMVPGTRFPCPGMPASTSAAIWHTQGRPRATA